MILTPLRSVLHHRLRLGSGKHQDHLLLHSFDLKHRPDRRRWIELESFVRRRSARRRHRDRRLPSNDQQVIERGRPPPSSLLTDRPPSALPLPLDPPLLRLQQHRPDLSTLSSKSPASNRRRSHPRRLRSRSQPSPSLGVEPYRGGGSRRTRGMTPTSSRGSRRSARMRTRPSCIVIWSRSVKGASQFVPYLSRTRLIRLGFTERREESTPRTKSGPTSASRSSR